MTVPPDPPFRKPMPLRPVGGTPENAANSATLALQGHLVDPDKSVTPGLDPLAHLEPPPVATARAASLPPLPRREPRSDDDELSDLFSEGPDPEGAPTLLDPDRRLPDDPLALLQHPGAELRRPETSTNTDNASSRLGGADAPRLLPIDMPARPGPTTPSGADASPIIPDDWDPGLTSRTASQPAPPPRPAAVPNTPRRLPLPPLRPEPPAESAGGGRQASVSAVPPPAEPADNGVDQAMVLLRRREAARGAAPDTTGPIRAPTAPPIERPAALRNPVASAPSVVGGAEPAAAAALPADDVIEALWRALGIDPSRISTADQRRLLGEVGQTIREIAEGLIQILAARQHLKSEFRVDQTVLRATENNLFKFTRNADELLSLAMTNRNRVFMPMNQAAREALNDIKAHEMATLAAVQLSIRAVLDRFQPAKLARQAEEQPRGRFDWLRLRSLKARYWDCFANMYGNLAADADEASNRIFTAEFGRAYRERVEKRPGR